MNNYLENFPKYSGPKPPLIPIKKYSDIKTFKVTQESMMKFLKENGLLEEDNDENT